MRRLAGLRVDHRILEVPEVTLHGLLEHLVVADGRLQVGVPVHQPLAAVDLAVLEQPEERLADRSRTSLVQRKTQPLPVAATAKLLELRNDAGLVLLLPLPDSLDQPLAAQIMPRLLLLFEQPPFDHRLR